MDAYLDGLLDELVPADPRESWSDVLHRARRSRRRYVGLVATVSALVLVPTAWAAISAFEGTPAPQVIQQDFVRWNAAAPNTVIINPESGFVTHVPTADASKAHGVLQLSTSDGQLDMWAAPELDGSGMCWFVGWESDMQGDEPLGHGACTRADGGAIEPETWADANHPAYTVMEGSVTGNEATLDVTLTDGGTTTLPVVEHLFLGALPAGSQLASITGLTAGGTVVATWPQSGS